MLDGWGSNPSLGHLGSLQTAVTWRGPRGMLCRGH